MGAKREPTASKSLEAVRQHALLFSVCAEFSALATQALESNGYLVSVVDVFSLLPELISKQSFSVVLFDEGDEPSLGQRFLSELGEEISDSSVLLVFSASPAEENSLKFLRLGADDYLEKPSSESELSLLLKKSLERERIRSEKTYLRNQVNKRYSFSNIIASSSQMLEIFETIKKVADYKTTIMLNGESGTGKELIAKAIHFNSARKSKRFVAINCGAIPENLLESELFGHKKGAFTDATRDKLGLFQEADGGTILLDEIGEMPLHLQVKLLRVLQESEILPVGETSPLPINVRVVAATLRDLESDIIDGRFRDDLYYRLNVVTIRIPPLRERKDDIPLLTNYFIKNNHDRLGLPVYGISKAALGILLDYSWPGNIRELENCIERAMILTNSDEITPESLPKAVKKSESTSNPYAITDDELSIKLHSRKLEEALIRKALEKTCGNRTHAAKLLEISHRTLLYKLKEYDLTDVGGD